MRWAYARSDERSDHVRAIWSARLECEGQNKVGSQLPPIAPPPALQAAFSNRQRPAPGPRNYSHQSEQSDASYRSEQSEPHYVPAFYAPDDVHLPPIQGQFGGSPVPPTLLRGLNISDETIQELPAQGSSSMWVDGYSSGKRASRDSAMSTPSAFNGDSPLQAFSSDQSSRGQTGDSSSASYTSRSNGAMPGSSIHGSPVAVGAAMSASGGFFRVTVGAGQGTYSSGAAPYGQSPQPTDAGSEAYMSATADTYAPYGDDRSQDDSVDDTVETSSYTTFYPSTT